MATVHKKLGACVLPRDLRDIGQEDSPQYDLYTEQTDLSSAAGNRRSSHACSSR